VNSAEPLITWPDPIFELISFLAFFLAAGAVGFRMAVLPGLLRASEPAEREFARGAARRAAMFGLFGTLVTAGFTAQRLAGSAAEKHVALSAFVSSQPNALLQVILLAVTIAGFGLALAGVGLGWGLAVPAVVVGPFRAAFFGQIARVVNPVHELAGGLWIGTLFLMVVAGIAPALRSGLGSGRRGAGVSRMVNGFSPLALGAAALLATMGVITAWRHLKRLSSLWTTPYGWALCVKLLLVAGVLALGAWNWRRQKPLLGSEAGGVALRRSASWELTVAGLVLLVTAVLVSLPSPR